MHKYMHLISFVPHGSCLSWTLISISTFAGNRLLGTGNCSIHSITAVSLLPFWTSFVGFSWPKEGRQPKVYSIYKLWKIACEIVLCCKKVKTRLPDKLAQERELTKSSPSGAFEIAKWPAMGQSNLDWFLSHCWWSLFPARWQMVVLPTLAVLWRPCNYKQSTNTRLGSSTHMWISKGWIRLNMLGSVL